MRKSKILNASIIDNTGARTTPVIVIGEYNGFSSGEILDANALVLAIKDGRIVLGPIDDTEITPQIQLVLNLFQLNIEQVNTKIQALEDWRGQIINNAPEEYDTLGEVAEAINNINEYHQQPKATVDMNNETIVI